jgi:hypothetical protein
MHEILPGVFHWTAPHPKIHVEVSSYWLDRAGVLFDPLVPHGEGLHWFDTRPTRPGVVLLSNRHHYRESDQFADHYGCEVLCNRAGMHEFEDDQRVQPFDLGDELPGGVLACEMDAICDDDTALYVREVRALVIADGVVRGGPHGAQGLLGFVPDRLMDDPIETKRGLLASCERLLAELDFEHLLLAHGGPVIGRGRDALRDLLDSGGRTAF